MLKLRAPIALAFTFVIASSLSCFCTCLVSLYCLFLISYCLVLKGLANRSYPRLVTQHFKVCFESCLKAPQDFSLSFLFSLSVLFSFGVFSFIFCSRCLFLSLSLSLFLSILFIVVSLCAVLLCVLNCLCSCVSLCLVVLPRCLVLF